MWKNIMLLPVGTVSVLGILYVALLTYCTKLTVFVTASVADRARPDTLLTPGSGFGILDLFLSHFLRAL
jgi:hypothetical protein